MPVIDKEQPACWYIFCCPAPQRATSLGVNVAPALRLLPGREGVWPRDPQAACHLLQCWTGQGPGCQWALLSPLSLPSPLSHAVTSMEAPSPECREGAAAGGVRSYPQCPRQTRPGPWTPRTTGYRWPWTFGALPASPICLAGPGEPELCDPISQVPGVGAHLAGPGASRWLQAPVPSAPPPAPA